MVNEIKQDMLLKKHSALIQINNQMTAQQRKLFNILLLNSNKNKWDKNNLSSIELRNIKKILGIEHKNNKFIKDNLKKLKNISIEYNILEKDKEVWGNFSLIQEPEIRNGVLTYSLPYRIRQTIEGGKPPFALLDVSITTKLNNKFAIVLYELLIDYYSVKLKKLLLPRLTILQLKLLLGVDEHKYKLFKDFKKNVLEKAIIELKSVANMDVSYELEKEGTKYTHIRMLLKDSTPIVQNTKIIEEYLTKNEVIINEYKECFEDKGDGLTFKEVRKIPKMEKFELIFEDNGFETEIELNDDDYKNILMVAQSA